LKWEVRWGGDPERDQVAHGLLPDPGNPHAILTALSDRHKFMPSGEPSLQNGLEMAKGSMALVLQPPSNSVPPNNAETLSLLLQPPTVDVVPRSARAVLLVNNHGPRIDIQDAVIPRAIPYTGQHHRSRCRAEDMSNNHRTNGRAFRGGDERATLPRAHL
jgi:hypothetical protein